MKIETVQEGINLYQKLNMRLDLFSGLYTEEEYFEYAEDGYDEHIDEDVGIIELWGDNGFSPAQILKTCDMEAYKKEVERYVRSYIESGELCTYHGYIWDKVLEAEILKEMSDTLTLTVRTLMELMPADGENKIECPKIYLISADGYLESLNMDHYATNEEEIKDLIVEEYSGTDRDSIVVDMEKLEATFKYLFDPDNLEATFKYLFGPDNDDDYMEGQIKIAVVPHVKEEGQCS